ncbi:MAG: hypothetical protein ACFFCB_08375 [Candidatus Odinarchaeota archaeon]
MDEGSKLEETNIRPRDILRNRYWIFDIIWSGVSILLIWYILFSGFFVFLFNPLGLILFFIGVVVSLVLQIRYTLGWPSRIPFFVPNQFGKTKTTQAMIIFIIIWLPIHFLTTWIFVTNPWLVQILYTSFLALLAFVFGVLILGLWPSLVGLIRWENREGIRIVKQGNKFIALDQDEVCPPKAGNT